MTDTTIGSAPATVPTDTSTVKVDKLKGTSLEGMAVQMMAAIIMLEVAQVKKKEAELKIAEMKAQNDRARAINDFLDKIRSKMGGITKDENWNKLERGEILAKHLDEARDLGIDTSGWGGN